MPDLEAAVASPARVVVDSTAATPVYLRPLEPAPTSPSTARRSTSAATHDVLLGAVACRSTEDAERLREFRGRTGIVAAPDPCWLLSRSLKTLRVRMERHTASATAIAEPPARPPGGRGRPLPGLRRTALVRRRRRRGRSQGRDLAADDRERHQPRRRRVGAGVANALGGRPRAAGPAPPERRPRGRGRALGRPRASPGLSTYVFFPEGAFGPTNNCVGIGRVLLERGERVVFVVEESFAGTLEAQGFEEALMRLKPAPGGRGGAGPVLEGLRPRHGARVPQADDRAARDLRAPRLAGARRRRSLRGRAARRDLRRARAGRDRPGQRGRLPGGARLGPAVGADRLLQPAGAEGPGAAAGLLRLPAPATGGWDEFRERYRELHDRCSSSSRPSARSAARRRCRSSSSCTSRRG